MMNMYRAVFSDIDGTLINSRHQMSPRTLRSVQQLAARQIPFVLVSARPPLGILPFARQIGGNNVLIAFNGALIVDAQLQTIYSVRLEQADVQALTQLLEGREGIFPNYYHGIDWYSSAPENPWTRQEEEITQLSASLKPNNLADAHKILVMGEAQKILALEQELRPQFPHLEIHRSKATYLEIVHQAATKAQALQFMQAHLGVKREEVLAFGDNYNDVDMLQYAGYGVAMANAPREIRAQADWVTASNDEDGVAVVLERLFDL